MRLKLGMNNYRLSTVKTSKLTYDIILTEQIKNVFSLASPYEIRDGARYNVILNKKISEKKIKFSKQIEKIG